MPQNESFFGYLNALVKEARDALGNDAKVDDPLEYRFDIEFPNRRYAFQAYPEEHRIFVGQYLGASGVVWFDELRFDDVHHGWRSANDSAFDFFRSLVNKPTLTTGDIERAAAETPQSGPKESPTSVEQHEELHGERQAAGRPAPRSAQPAAEAGEESLAALARSAYHTVRSVRRRIPSPWSVAKRTASKLIGRGPRAGR